MKRIFAVLVFGLVLLLPAGVGATPASTLLLSNATVTATSANGESAVSLTVKNVGDSPISLVSVMSPSAAMGMLFFDTNLRRGSYVMRLLSNISISPHATLHLGFENQGAMLSLLRKSLKIGQTVRLEVKWTNYAKARTSFVVAHVIKAPKGLHFDMPNMSM
jgi:copper(I)-binding protein